MPMSDNTIHGDKATNSSLFTINGDAVVIPASITFTVSDLDSENSFRTISGLLQRDVIATKRKLDCEWSGLSGSELATLLKAMDHPFFKVSFIDPSTNSMESMACYVGDRSPVTAFYRTNGDGEMEAIYESFSCSLIEK